MKSLRKIVLVAHGSPAHQTREEFEKLVGQIRLAGLGDSIHLAFLSVGQPDLEQALESLAQEPDTREIWIQPLLVFTGKHLLVDLPATVDKFRSKYPNIALQAGIPLGSWPGFAQFLAESLHGLPQ